MQVKLYDHKQPGQQHSKHQGRQHPPPQELAGGSKKDMHSSQWESSCDCWNQQTEIYLYWKPRLYFPTFFQA